MILVYLVQLQASQSTAPQRVLEVGLDHAHDAGENLWLEVEMRQQVIALALLNILFVFEILFLPIADCKGKAKSEGARQAGVAQGRQCARASGEEALAG